MNWNPLESGTIAGDSPVQVKTVIDSGILSSAGHVKPCVNLPGPVSYTHLTLPTMLMV